LGRKDENNNAARQYESCGKNKSSQPTKPIIRVIFNDEHGNRSSLLASPYPTAVSLDP